MMADVIVKQVGCRVNEVAYGHQVDAFHQALRLLGEKDLAPAGPGFSLDLAGGSTVAPIRTGVTVHKTERRSWIVASIDEVHHEVSAVECATRQEAQSFALRMARHLAADKVRDLFNDLTGRAIGRAHLARLARQAEGIEEARTQHQATAQAARQPPAGLATLTPSSPSSAHAEPK